MSGNEDIGVSLELSAESQLAQVNDPTSIILTQEQINNHNLMEMDQFIDSCNQEIYYVVENVEGFSPVTIIQNNDITFNQELDHQNSYIEPNSDLNVAIQEINVNEIPMDTNIVIVENSEQEKLSDEIPTENNQPIDSKSCTLTDSCLTDNSALTTAASILYLQPEVDKTEQLTSMDENSKKFFDSISKDVNIVNAKGIDNDIISQPSSTMQTNSTKINKNPAPNTILDNFAPKLSKSPKTYSRSNIVWITPESSKNENGLNSNKNEIIKNKSLTTTIEISQSDDINLNSLSDNSRIDLPHSMSVACSSTSSKDLNNDEEKLREIDSLLRDIDDSNINSASKIFEKNDFLVNSSKRRRDTVLRQDIKTPVLNQSKSNSRLSSLTPKETEDKLSTFNQLTKNKKKVGFNLKANSVLDVPQFESEISNKRPIIAKESRDVIYHSDYNVNNLVIHVRIQPESRPIELNDISLLCNQCGLNFRTLKLYQVHKKICFLPTPTKTNNSIKSPKASNSVKRQKLTFDNNIEPVASTSEVYNVEVPDNFVLNSDLNSDSDLNESDASQSSDEEKKLDGHSENDVIWVRIKFGHWPALIRKVYLNERKLSLRLIDCPLKKESLKTHVNAVTSFNDASVNKKFISEYKNKDDHLIKAVHKVEDYLRKRCLGTNVNPYKFFNFAELYNKQSDNADNKVETNEDNISKFSIENSKILETIKGEKKIETHLIGVYRGNIHSDFHQNFVTSGEDKDIFSTGFGPFKDGEEKDELIEILKQLYTNEKISFSIKYIFEVWAPEAIIKAITRVHHVSYDEAVEIYNSFC